MTQCPAPARLFLVVSHQGIQLSAEEKQRVMLSKQLQKERVRAKEERETLLSKLTVPLRDNARAQ